MKQHEMSMVLSETFFFSTGSRCLGCAIDRAKRQERKQGRPIDWHRRLDFETYRYYPATPEDALEILAEVL